LNLIRITLENGDRASINPNVIAIMRRTPMVAQTGKPGVAITFIDGNTVTVRHSLDQLLTLCGFPPKAKKAAKKS